MYLTRNLKPVVLKTPEMLTTEGLLKNQIGRRRYLDPDISLETEQHIISMLISDFNLKNFKQNTDEND